MTTSLLNATGIAMGESPTLINSTSALPNPFTPLAFLPPDVARQFTVFVYILVGTASILIWDVICHFKDDYRLLAQHRINFATVVYFVARLSNLLYLIGMVVVNSAPIGSCNVVIQVVQSFFAVAVPASEMLFFLHVRAVYISNRPAVYLFTFFWLCTVISSIAPMFSIKSTTIGSTQYCISNGSLPLYVTISAVVPLVNDSVLFGALVIRLLRSSYQERTLKGDIRAMVFGDHIPLVSRALLQNGQAYFLSTVFFNLATVTLYLTNNLPAIYRSTLGFPSVVLMNVMASRIYRNTKFGRFNSAATSSIPPVPSSSMVYRHSPGYTGTGPMVVPQVSVVTTQTLFRDAQSMADDERTPTSTPQPKKEFDMEALR